jgi:hypothetical protein
MARTMTLREELLYKMHVFEGRWEKFAKKNDLEVRFIGNEDFYKLVEKAAVIRAILMCESGWSDFNDKSFFEQVYGKPMDEYYYNEFSNLDRTADEVDKWVRNGIHSAYNHELEVFNEMLRRDWKEIREHRLEEAMETRLESNKIALMQVRESHRDVYDGVSERSIVQAYDEYVNCGKDW